MPATPRLLLLLLMFIRCQYTRPPTVTPHSTAAERRQPYLNQTTTLSSNQKRTILVSRPHRVHELQTIDIDDPGVCQFVWNAGGRAVQKRLNGSTSCLE